MKFPLFSLLILTLLVSCSVEKRKYQKGFYISNTGKVKGEPSLPSTSSALRALPVDTCDLLVFSDGTKIPGQLVSSGDRDIQYTFCNDKVIHKIPKQRMVAIEKRNGDVDYFDGRQNFKAARPAPPTPTIVALPSETIISTAGESPTLTTNKAAPCEVIFFRDGEEISVKVMEVGIEDVRYKLCGMQEGPVFVKSKSSIFMIRYADGSKDVFKENSAPINSEVKTELPKSTNSSLAVLALTFSILGIYPLFLIGSITALVLGCIYLRKNPFEDYTSPSRKKAVAGLIISGITMLLFAFVLFLLLI